jgi:hypothetical protein
MSPDLVLRQARDKVLFVALMVSLSNHEGVAPE